MAEENKEQGPGQEQEQEPEQGEEQVQEPAREPEEPPQKDEPAGEKGEGLLMPVLYALLAAVGAFTLIMIIGIVVTFFTQPAQPSETPSTQPPSQGAQAPVRAQGPDGEGAPDQTLFSFL